ncbi:MAG: hypothetical protein ACM3UU_01720 [Ignavibacteriales bacterium]
MNIWTPNMEFMIGQIWDQGEGLYIIDSNGKRGFLRYNLSDRCFDLRNSSETRIASFVPNGSEFEIKRYGWEPVGNIRADGRVFNRSGTKWYCTFDPYTPFQIPRY